jgi:tetratricopeptide (TPR) repeat protein
MTSEKLSNAVQLIKSGNKQAAQPILEEFVQENPNDENAWLWLYVCVDEVEDKKYCLQRALEINPDNQPAHNALRKLTDGPLPPLQGSAPAAAPPPPVVPGNKPIARQGKRPWIFALSAGGLLLLCLCGCPLIYVSNPAPFQPIIVSLIPLPTSPSSTPAPVLTAAAFNPGDPTATPLGADITDPNFKEGVAAYNAGQYETAIDLMSAVIKANPNLAPPYRHRGMAYFYLNDCSIGMRDVEKALSIDPNYASAWAAHGALNLCLGNLSKSVPDLQKALSLDGSLAVARQNLGSAFYELSDYQKSVEEYGLSVAIDPGRARAWSGRGDAYYELEQYAQAIADYKVALSLVPEDNHIYCRLSYSYFEIKEYQNALDAANSYKFVNSSTCSERKLVILQVHSARALGDDQQALQYLDRAIARGWDALYYYHRGVILQDTGKNEEAARDLKLFISLAPNYKGPEVADAQARLAKLEP